MKLPPSSLSFSGNLVVETKFFDDKDLITVSKVRLYYV